MGRCTVMRWAFAAGLLLLAGCATTSRTLGPFGKSGDADHKSSTIAKKRNPFKHADSDAAKDDSQSDDEDGEESTGDGPSTAKSKRKGTKSDSLDPELSKLVEEELKHEPAEKRERTRSEWAKLDPAFIRELIETRRMARQVAENHHRPISLASSESPADSDEREADDRDDSRDSDGARNPRRPASGLGSASPWGKSDDLRPGRAGAAASRRDAGARQHNPEDGDAFDGVSRDAQTERPIVIAPRSTSERPLRIAAGASRQRPRDVDPDGGDADDGPVSKGSPARNVQTAAVDSPGGQTVAGTDDPVIQPGVAAPASVLNHVPHASRASRRPSGSDGVVSASMTSAPSGSPRTGAQRINGTSSAQGTQPIQLGGPMDIPAGPAAGTAMADAAAPTGKAAAGGAQQPANGTGTGGLAGLGGRLMGVINPNQGAARNAAQPSAGWRDELQRIVSTAANDAGQTSVGSTDPEKLAYIEKQVQLRMLYIVAGQPARSLEPIPGLEAADQEFWQQVFWAVSNYFDAAAIADPSDRATQTITQLRTAVQRLQEKSKLELRNVAFCHKIVNYGNYERFGRDEFTPGQPVLLYAEVGNFKSEPSADGPYRTILKSTIEIFDSRGQLIQNMPFPPTEDVCSNPRRDYYNSYEFVVPQRIGLGPHVLKLTVVDEISQKIATYTVNFTVK